MVTKPDIAKLASDAARITSAVDSKIPEGRLKRLFNRLKAVAPPYTFERLASSAYMRPSLHMFSRAGLALLFVGVFFTVFKESIMLALPAAIVYFCLYAALSIFSMRYKTFKRVSRITMLREAIIMGVVYQTLASIALWMLPLAVFAAVRNQARSNPKHLILYVAHALPAGAFVLDTLLLGSAPYFRKLAVPIPFLIECLLVLIATKTGKLKKPKTEALQTFWKIFIAGTLIWALGSAFIALWISRATNCCDAKSSEEDADVKDEGDIVDSDGDYMDVEMGHPKSDPESNQDGNQDGNRSAANTVVQQGG